MEHHATHVLKLGTDHRDRASVISSCGSAFPGCFFFAVRTSGREAMVVWLFVAVLLALALGAAMIVMLARHRRMIAELSARLDAVENPHPSVASGSASGSPEPGDSAPPGDVLHGHTSYVRAMIDGADAGAKSLADQVILAVHDRLEDPVSPRQLAAAVNVSVRTLERVLLATLGCSPRQLILAMKMREAQRLLCAHELRVSEIAYRLGFSSAAHFSTRFRGFSGMTPTAYRRSTLSRDRARRRSRVPATQRNSHGH